MSDTAVLERKGGDIAATILGLEVKGAATAADIAPASGLLSVDPEQGLVKAIVSVTGIVDNVDDRIMPGAYTKTLKDRRPKGVWSHDWKDWVSRTKSVEEYLPGDERLPKETKDGKPWPKEAGALVVETQFNMKSARSKEAFLAVEFFSETGECEWSIGYVVPPGQASKDAKGVRNIKSLNLFEYGPVLFGAASQSMTLSVKSLDPAADIMRKTIEGLGGSDFGDEPALPDGSFTIHTKSDVPPALAAYLNASDRPEAKAHIMVRATRLGGIDLLPTKWQEECQAKVDAALATENATEPLEADEEADLLAFAEEQTPETEAKTLAEIEVKYDTSPVGTPGGKQNWVDKSGGLPDFIRAIAHALIRNGKTESTAIATAVATCKRWAAGEGKVTEKTKAKAAAAIAEFEAKAKAAKATPSMKGLIVEEVEHDLADGYDPSVEIKDAAPVDIENKGGEDCAVESKMYGTPNLPGSFEQRRQGIQQAANLLLRGAPRLTPSSGYDGGYTRYEWDDVNVQATFLDHAIVTRVKWSAPDGNASESFSIDYTIDEDTGDVTLGEMQPVRLSVVTVVEPNDETGDTGEKILPIDAFLALPDMLEEVTLGTKALIALNAEKANDGAVETKQGRVLSGANEQRLRAAAEHLFAVLRGAGIPIEEPGASDKPVVDTTGADTTAPSATTQVATGGKAPSVKDGEPGGIETKIVVPEGKMILPPDLAARALRLTAGLDA